MTAPLIIGLVALLLFVSIGYNIIQQYKEKLATERRITIAKQRAIVIEVDELLLNATHIPFSKVLLLIMQQRIRNALVVMINNSPNSTAMREHLKSTDMQIKQIRETYKSQSAEAFKAPNSDSETLAMLQTTKKLRSVIRSEHTKGKISTDTFVSENHSIEIMQLKIHLQSGFKKVNQAITAKQFNIASKIISKFLDALASVTEQDAYLQSKQNELLQIQNKIKLTTTQNAKNAVDKQIKDSNDKKDDLGVDSIFQDKKKW